MKTKNRISRFLTVMLITALITQSVFPAKASAKNNMIQKIGNGTYYIGEEVINKGIEIAKTEFDGIFQLSDGTLLMKDYEKDIFYEMVKEEVRLDDIDSVNNVIEKLSLGDELTKDLYSYSLAATRDREAIKVGYVFKPKNSTSLSKGVTTTYNGHTMEYEMFYSSVQTKQRTIVSGQGTLDALKLLHSMIMSGANSTLLGIAGGFSSVYAYLTQGLSLTGATSSSDHCVVEVKYSYATRYVYVYEGSSRYLGLKTNQVSVSKITETLYYTIPGGQASTYKIQNPNKSFNAPHYYNNFWAYAYNQYMTYGNFVTENIAGTVYSLLFVKTY